MERFTSLRPCLRKPCPWREQCRQLHLPYGESENEENIKTIPNYNSCSGVCSLPGGSTRHTYPSAKTREGKVAPKKEGEPAPAEREFPSKKEESSHATFKGKLATKEEKGQILNKIFLRRAESSHEDLDGNLAEEAGQEGKKIGEDTTSFIYPILTQKYNLKRTHCIIRC